MNPDFEEFFEYTIVISKDCSIQDAITLLPTCRGVIFFAGENNQPIQLLMSANIRSLAKARLIQDNNESKNTKKAKLHEIVKRIYCLCCYSEFKSYYYYYEIAQQIYPDNFKDLVKLPKPEFVSINLNADWPNFQTTSTISHNSGRKTFGPFPTRKSTNEFITILRDSLSLCHRTDLVASPSKAKSCPYLQMNTCPAPCVGKIDKNEYLERIQLAVEAASGNIEPAKSFLSHEMKRSARELDFEKANDIKSKIAQLEEIHSHAYEWTADIQDFKLLHIAKSVKLTPQKGKSKIQTYDGFCITKGQIFELSNFTLNKTQIIEKEINMIEDMPEDNDQHEEVFAILSFFLYRNSKAGLWLNLSKSPASLNNLQDQVKSMK